MKQWKSVDDVLDFAIGEEEAAVTFYTGLAKQARNAAVREVFEGFAKEEKAHKAKLQGVRIGDQMLTANDKVVDLQIADYVVAAAAGPDMTYQDALTVAMKKEKASFALYTRLAEMATDAELRKLFFALAQEEAKHKLRFEMEYDDFLRKAEQ